MRPENFSLLKRQVFSRQRTLAEIFSKSGHLSLADYARTWEVSSAENSERQIFLQEMRTLLETLYSPDTAAQITAQLNALPLLSTIDHLGLLNHPFFLNSNLIFSLRQDLKFLPVLATAGVSLNNSSWPGCLVRNSPGGILKRYSFYPDRLKTTAVLAAPRLTENRVKKVQQEILRDYSLAPAKRQELERLVTAVFEDPKLLALKTFSAQASLLSGKLWKYFFPQAQNLVCLPLEEIVSRMLIRHITPNPGHALHRLIFTAGGQDAIQREFAGSLGAFSLEHKGSFLFWGIDPKGRRVHLHRKASHIADTVVDLELHPEIIALALTEGRLYPTSLLCFLTLLYYGLTALGGFNQVNWLSDIKFKFVKVLRDLEELDLAARVSGEVTENFAEGGLAFLPEGNETFSASGIDLYLHHRKDWFLRYQDLAKSLTVGESIESRLPEIYRVITPASDRQTALLSITDKDITLLNGSTEKIRAALK